MGRETHKLPNHGGRIFSDICNHHEDYSGKTHRLSNHGAGIMSDMCSHGEGKLGKGFTGIQPRHRDRLGNMYSLWRLQTERIIKLSNHGARVAQNMLSHGKGYWGRETHGLSNHGSGVALEMCITIGYLGGDSQSIQPWHQGRVRYVYPREGYFGKADSRAIQPRHRDRLRNV